jgi:hypothetical protein
VREVCRLAFAVAALVVIPSLAMAEQEKTQKLTLTLRTQTQAMAFELPAGVNIPGMADLGAPQRNIDGEAVYPTKAVEPIFVTVPADLGLPQNRLVLTVPRPAGGTTEGGPQEEGEEQAEPGVMTMKLYWHPDVAEGPITETLDGRRFAMPTGRLGGPVTTGIEDLDATLDRVATGSQGQFPEDAVGQGNYVLNTGGTAVLDGFLPPIKVTAPKAIAAIAASEGIDVQWEPVEGARGYILHASTFRSEGENAMTVTEWVSTLHEPPGRVRQGYEQETTIDDDLANGILLPPDATSCKVPAGIFSDEDMLMLTVTAVGNDFYSRADGITVRGRIRSEWTAMKMGGMGGIPGLGEEGEAETEEGEG